MKRMILKLFAPTKKAELKVIFSGVLKDKSISVRNNLEMRAKSIDKVNIPDGNYKGRLGGSTVVIGRLSERIRFEVDKSVGDVSIGVYVTVKDGNAVVTSNNHY